MKLRGKLLAFVLALAFLAGCADDNEGTQDSPVDTDLKDNQAPYVINFPDMFMGMALKCVGDTLVISHTRPGSPVAIGGASACAEGEAEKIGIPRIGTP
jgi:hypothetical protein